MTATPAQQRVRVRLPEGFLGRLALVALGALVVRVVYVLAAKLDEPPMGDAIYYNGQARALAFGDGFADPFMGGPTAEHPPLTAMVLSPVSLVVRVFDADTSGLLAQRFAMVVLGVVVVVLIGLIGRAVAGDRVGLAAAGIAALYPNLWVNDALVMSETIATLTVALAILLAYRYWRTPTTVNVIWLGGACGLAALARAELALLVPLVVWPMVVIAWRADTRRLLAAAGFATLASVVVVSPWVVANLIRFEEPVLFSDNDGLTLCGANTDAVYYGRGTGLWALDCAFIETPPGDRSVRSAALRDEAVDYVSDHLERVPIVVAARVARVWSAWDPAGMVDYNRNEGREPAVSWAGFASFWILVPFAVLGARALRRSRIPVTPLVAQFVLVTITAAAIYGLVRFRVPAEVALVVLAAVPIGTWLDRRAAVR